MKDGYIDFVQETCSDLSEISFQEDGARSRTADIHVDILKVHRAISKG